MGQLAFDIRDAVRGFRRDRGYAATVVLTLALTIGATTAVFSIVNGVLLAPLAYRNPDRLVSIREIWVELADRIPSLDVNERHFEHWRTHAGSFDALAQFVVLTANLTGRGDAAQVAIARCSGSLFDVLHVRAALGRTLTPADEPYDAADVVTISDALWRRRFGADPGLVGSRIVLDGKARTVVGILPADFRLPARSQLIANVDAFVPIRLEQGWVGDHNDEAIGRLRPGVTLEQARAELDVLQRQVSEIATKDAHQPVTLATAIVPLTEHVVGTSRRGLLLLLGAIGGVLLIACSNLANLSLTRTLGRLRESAIRSALGASRSRLIGRALLEQLLLSAWGGAIGVAVASAALALLVRTAPVSLPRMNEVTLDARVLTFAAAVSILTGLLVAMVPAWRIAGGHAQAALRVASTAVTSDRGGLRSQTILLALQVGLSVTLLVVTALFAVSFLRVLNVDRGFSAERVLAVDIALPEARYGQEASRQRIYDRFLAAVRALPGVDAVTTTSLLPLNGQGQVNAVAREGSTRLRAELPTANFRFVAPEFFRTLGMSVRRGRPFADDERRADRPAPAVISEATAARLWPGEDPIGRRFGRAVAGEQGFEVVGIVADARTTSLDGAQPLMVYLPYWWRSRTSTTLLIRTKTAPASILADVRGVLRGIDPEIAVGRSRTLEDIVDAALSGRRYQTRLFLVFGLAALFIATVGVYAVTAYGVSSRRREMNIRVALGAERSEVVRLFLRQGTIPMLIGAAAGVAGAVALGGVLGSLLFGVRAHDPVIIATVAAIVGTVGLATCGFAVRRGLALDPASALRNE